MPSGIEAGFFSFVEVLEGGPREQSERGRGNVEGITWRQQWVATPELIERRLWADGDLAATRHLTLHLVDGDVADAAAALEAQLVSERLTSRARLSGTFALLEAYAAPGVRVDDPEAVPYRTNRGVFVTAQRAVEGVTEGAVDEVRQWYREVHIPDLLHVRGVTGCWWFEAPSGPTIRIYWLDDDPVSFHADLRAKTPDMAMIDLSQAYRTLLVGSYRPVPG